jgi:hypothetical protein
MRWSSSFWASDLYLGGQALSQTFSYSVPVSFRSLGLPFVG